MKENIIKKVVISRKKIIEFNRIIDINKLFNNLSQKNKESYMYLTIYNEKVLIGASPELLIKKKGNRITTNPLAGSRPKYNEETMDKKVLNELENSEKDIYEHKFVVDYIKKSWRVFVKNYQFLRDLKLLAVIKCGIFLLK